MLGLKGVKPVRKRNLYIILQYIRYFLKFFTIISLWGCYIESKCHGQEAQDKHYKLTSWKSRKAIRPGHIWHNSSSTSHVYPLHCEHTVLTIRILSTSPNKAKLVWTYKCTYTLGGHSLHRTLFVVDIELYWYIGFSRIMELNGGMKW